MIGNTTLTSLRLPSVILSCFYAICAVSTIHTAALMDAWFVPLSENSSLSSALYSVTTAKVQRDLLEYQKKCTKKKYCKYKDFKQCSKDKHILERGFEKSYCSILIDV